MRTFHSKSKIMNSKTKPRKLRTIARKVVKSSHHNLSKINQTGSRCWRFKLKNNNNREEVKYKLLIRFWRRGKVVRIRIGTLKWIRVDLLSRTLISGKKKFISLIKCRVHRSQRHRLRRCPVFSVRILKTNWDRRLCTSSTDGGRERKRCSKRSITQGASAILRQNRWRARTNHLLAITYSFWTIKLAIAIKLILNWQNLKNIRV